MLNLLRPRHLLHSIAFATVLGTTSMPSFAQTILMEGADVQITTADIQTEFKRIPAQVREQMLTRPEVLRQLIENLYLRRAFAHQAEQSGLGQLPETQYQLKTARETVLTEALLGHIDESAAVSDKTAEQLAQTTYKAEPQRFQAPAENRARHILVRGTDAAARAKAEKLLADLKAGANFEALAQKESADPGSAAKGGDLGFFAKGRMVKPFEDAVDALKQPGELSGIVQSDFGFHIIRLEERRTAGLRPFAEVREALIAEIKGKAQQEARKKEVERLQKEAKGDETALQDFIAAQTKSAASQPAAAPAPAKAK